MTISPEFLAAIRLVVREEVERVHSPHQSPAARVESMTVDEFAYVVRLHRETVLLKIRRRSIKTEHVSRKAKAIRIKPAALDSFGVGLEEAAARLLEFRASRPQRSAKPSSA